MKVELIQIEASTRKNKRLMAVFSNGKKTHFGQKDGETFIDHQDAVKRDNYISRHRVNEDWTDPTTASTLSRYILWERPTLSSAIRAFRDRFKV
jgi:hypothetical protein